MSTGIQWTDETWNPVTGCDKVSQGCKNCYAGSLAETRLRHLPEYADGFYGNVKIHPGRLYKPLSWRKPRKVFVNSMSDLFHDDVPFEFIAAVFGVMAACPQHIFQVLTKIPERATDFFQRLDIHAKKLKSGLYRDDELSWIINSMINGSAIKYCYPGKLSRACGDTWPLPNVWLGVSFEDQETADKRIPILLDIPAALRLVSCEPLLEPIDLSKWLWADMRQDGGGCARLNRIHWVIVGGECGSAGRPMNPEWVRSIRDQCVEAEVPLWFKQWGEWVPVDPDDEQYAGYPFGWWCDGGDWRNSGCHSDILMVKVGKSRAGNQLDGKNWEQFPGCINNEIS